MQKTNNKFLIATVAWKRPKILQLFLDVNSKYCDILCVKSSGDKTLEKFKNSKNIFFINVPNSPLGKKLNSRIDWFLKNENYTHIIFLGSDNIISPEIFDSIKNHSNKYDLISWSDIYYYNFETSQASYSVGYTNHRKGEPLAPGRCVSRKLLNKLGYLWPNDIEKNPDIRAWQNKLSKVENQIILNCKDVNGFIVDVKSKVNLNSYELVMSVKDNKRDINLNDKIKLDKLIKNIF